MHRANLASKFTKNAIRIAILCFIASKTLTACSFELKVPESITGKTVSDSTIDFVQDTVDNTDLTNEASVNDMNTAITNELAKSNIEMQKAKFVRVVDGDTIVVEINNEQKKVRLVGVDTPESVASSDYLSRTGKVNSVEGKNASAYTKEVLKNAEYVYLQKDKSETDRYGRLLRFVWLEVPSDVKDKSEIADKMLNGILLADHVAVVANYKPDVTLSEAFQDIYDGDYER